jgi:hypothetical protein
MCALLAGLISMLFALAGGMIIRGEGMLTAHESMK